MINRGASFLSLKQSAIYSRLLNTIKPVSALIVVKDGRPLVNHLLRMTSLIGLDRSLGLVKVIITFLRFCSNHIKVSGRKGLVMYLKACLVLLQQASGNHRITDVGKLGLRVSRTHTGYPRVIPILHRKRIRHGDLKIFRLWMTLFSLYRVIDFDPIFKLNTITDPCRVDLDPVLPQFGSFLYHFWSGLDHLTPRYAETRIGSAVKWNEANDFLYGLRASPFLISKTSATTGAVSILSPVTDKAKGSFDSDAIPDTEDYSPLSTSPSGILAATAAWSRNPAMFKVLKEWCTLTGNIWLLNRLDTWKQVLLMKHPDDPRSKEYLVIPRAKVRGLGRLGFKEEAAGKLRVFAMVDPFTQWLLKPLHDALFEILDLIPQDGTTDQLRPVHALMERYPKGPFYSYDLSAATDRLPLLVQKIVFGSFLTAKGADAWATLLVGRKYSYSWEHPTTHERFAGSVTYETGQPMGALSSWASLAITHHCIVQWAAFNVGAIKSGEWFDAYAVLGDDIIIAHTEVAQEYLRLMDLLGVDIGLAKSLISPKGFTLEFAKRTFFKGHDVSPVPFSEYWVGKQLLAAGLELVRKYNLTLAQWLDLNGFGYKAKGMVTGRLTSLGQRLRHKVLAYFSPGMPAGKSVQSFFAMKSLTASWKWTDTKVISFVEKFIQLEIARVEDSINSNAFNALIDQVKILTTVNRDREYYGTLSRSEPRARKIDFSDLFPDDLQSDIFGNKPDYSLLNKDIFYYVVDTLCETVYRETYFDILVKIRELKVLIEEFKARTEVPLDQLEILIIEYQEIQDFIASVPLPREIYKRVERETRTSNLEMVKQWEKYSNVLRSTRST